MATAEYNEVAYAAGGSPLMNDISVMDPLYKWDTRFPERLSRLHIHDESSMRSTREPRNRRMRNRNAARFKTQPITFDEIQEVDEDGTDEAKMSLKDQFTAFSRSMDGLMPARPDKAPTTAAGKERLLPPSQPGHPAKEKLREHVALLESTAMSGSLDQHERSRARRSKRRAKKGIQEVPETEKETSESQAG